MYKKLNQKFDLKIKTNFHGRSRIGIVHLSGYYTYYKTPCKILLELGTYIKLSIAKARFGKKVRRKLFEFDSYVPTNQLTQLQTQLNITI